MMRKRLHGLKLNTKYLEEEIPVGIDRFIEAILKIAQGDFEVELSVSERNDELDALAMGINMLVDDLKEKMTLSKENENIKALNKKLQAAQQKADENSNLKTKFIQNISHEIRTPLNAIIGFSEVLPYYIGDKQSLVKFSEIIHNSSIYLLHIVNDLLDISKIESGQLSLNNGIHSLEEISTEIRHFFDEYMHSLQKTDISLVYNINNAAISHKYIFDQSKVKQILINLINNAIKFTQTGVIEVNFNYNKETQLLFCSVRDSGPGISPDKLSSIFDRFVQLKNQNPNHPSVGTGLGLSIVKGLVSLMNGNIWVESVINKGTTFYFTIPLKQA